MSNPISKPMLFSGEMVRALLRDVDTKTQTRRLVKPQPFHGEIIDGVLVDEHQSFIPNHTKGSQIWVKETFARLHNDMLQHLDPGPDSPHWFTAYRADGEPVHWEHFGTNWTPSIFMPKSASRITLKVTEVRVQRLNDISEDDAMAEGILKIPYKESCGTRFLYGASTDQNEHGTTAKVGYQILWESINGKNSWALNPWVWAYTLRRV